MAVIFTPWVRSPTASRIQGASWDISWRDLTQAHAELDRIRVHDIVHQRGGDSRTMQVSAYEKLRLSAAWIAGRLEACGLSVVKQQETGGFVVAAAGRALTEQGI